MKKIVVLLIVLSLSCKKKDNQPEESPGTTTSSTTGGSTTGGATGGQTTTVTVSGYGMWLLRTSHSPTVNTIETSFLDKDTTFVEVLVNGGLKMAYLTVPTMTINVYKSTMLYENKTFVNKSLVVTSPQSQYIVNPAIQFTTNVGDSVQVNTIYKPFKTYDPSDVGKMAVHGIVISGTSTVALTGATIAGSFESKRWRQTSTNTELCSGLSIRTKAK